MPVVSGLRHSALDELLLYRLSRLLAAAGGMAARLCESRYGITRREWRVLALLAHDEGLLSSQLAERAQLDRAQTSKAITSLAAKKLVRRETRAADRRQASLALTDEGRAVYAALLPHVQEINRELLAVLGAGEAPRLESMLERLQVKADAMIAQAGPGEGGQRPGMRARP